MSYNKNFLLYSSPLKRCKVNPFFHWLGKFILRISGWRVERKLPDISKAVLIAAHHTSNWDFIIGLMASFVWKIEAFWLAKHTLFRWPLGGFLKWLGGIPVNRNSSYKIVDQVIEAFQNNEKLLITMTPEGTRKKVEKWKSGFYYIAKGAGIPIICVFIDYGRKTCGIGPIITPT